jgi:hypothetical protein
MLFNFVRFLVREIRKSQATLPEKAPEVNPPVAEAPEVNLPEVKVPVLELVKPIRKAAPKVKQVNFKSLKGVDVHTATAFQEYHEKNPHIYEAFLGIALELLEAGHEKYSAKGIMEVVRWQNAKKGETVKVNNDYTSFYARVVADNHPKLSKFFEFRQVTGLNRAKRVKIG